MPRSFRKRPKGPASPARVPTMSKATKSRPQREDSSQTRRGPHKRTKTSDPASTSTKDMSREFTNLIAKFDEAGADPDRFCSVLDDVAGVATHAHVRRSLNSYYIALAKVFACQCAIAKLPKIVASEIIAELKRRTGQRSDALRALLTLLIKTEGTPSAVRKQISRDRLAIRCAEREGWGPDEFYANLKAPGGGLEKLAERHRPPSNREKPQLPVPTVIPEDQNPFVDDATEGDDEVDDRLTWGNKPHSQKPPSHGLYAFIGELKNDGELRVRTVVSLGCASLNKKNRRAFRENAARLLLTNAARTPAKMQTRTDKGGGHG